ncbi:MAG: hypothetical protein AAF468_12630 [Pseudomonadota bacterium]
MDLSTFLLAQISRPFRWGETDCCSLCDEWVRHVRGVSPMAMAGLNPRSAGDAKEIQNRFNGHALAVSRTMRRAGFAMTRTPERGDIGLAVFGGFLATSIFAGEKWFARNEDGIFYGPPYRVLAAWRVMI